MDTEHEAQKPKSGWSAETTTAVAATVVAILAFVVSVWQGYET